LRVVFAGTPPFAARALEALVAAGHSVALVLTQPDRPAGRGMRLASSAVAQTAQRLGLRLFKPATLRDPDSVAPLREAAPDVIVVAAYGLILPREVLDIPASGCINIHASLLPRWRGAAPIQRALLAGDAKTGITLMRMDAGLDTGAILAMREVPIGVRDTAASLTESLSELGAQASVEALAQIDSLHATPQDNAHATYAAKITKAEARIDWNRPCLEIDRAIRAFNPAPGAESRLDGETLKIWEASPAAGSGRPGEVLDAQAGRFVVGCADGALQLHVVQRPGGKRLAAADFLRGAPLARGTLLETAAPGAA
jgi:methionyl-tRNA formyltransferase